MEANEAVLFGIVQGTVAFDALSNFETGEVLEDTGYFMNALLEDPTWIGATGEPDQWSSDTELSSATTLVSGGVEVPYGTVHLVGCLRSGWELSYSEPPPSGESSPKTVLADAITVKYQPATKVWLITEQRELTDQEAAPDCMG